jgi:hypothetical protein
MLGPFPGAFKSVWWYGDGEGGTIEVVKWLSPAWRERLVGVFEPHALGIARNDRAVRFQVAHAPGASADQVVAVTFWKHPYTEER